MAATAELDMFAEMLEEPDGAAAAAAGATPAPSGRLSLRSWVADHSSTANISAMEGGKAPYADDRLPRYTCLPTCCTAFAASVQLHSHASSVRLWCVLKAAVSALI